MSDSAFVRDTPHDDRNSVRSVATSEIAAAWTRETTPTTPKPPEPQDTEWYKSNTISPDGFNSMPSSPYSSTDTVTENVARGPGASMPSNAPLLSADRSVAASNLTINAFAGGRRQPTWLANARPVQPTPRPYPLQTAQDTANQEAGNSLAPDVNDHNRLSIQDYGDLLKNLASDEAFRGHSEQQPDRMLPFVDYTLPKLSEMSGESNQDTIMHDQMFFKNSHFNDAHYNNPDFLPEMYTPDTEEYPLNNVHLSDDKGREPSVKSHKQGEDQHMSGVLDDATAESTEKLASQLLGEYKSSLTDWGAGEVRPFVADDEASEWFSISDDQFKQQAAERHFINMHMSNPESDREINGYQTETGHAIEDIDPTEQGFKRYILQQIPLLLTNQYKYLVDRIAHQMLSQYERLLSIRVAQVRRHVSKKSHPKNMQTGSFYQTSAEKLREMNEDDGGKYTTIGKFKFGSDIYPPDIPVPPVAIPAEFECPICFRDCKVFKPTDWINHVHGDVQPYTCTWDRCRDPKLFKRKADWVRHENEGHRHLEFWTCDVDDCHTDRTNIPAAVYLPNVSGHRT
ncbi:hypothetical protein GGR57DRAFT_288429 [Xylariaceae sp. FL1272]|nr:hypothetical protein GGR57DRAFT_288429 [Xylariaceae sp. FL1272]